MSSECFDEEQPENIPGSAIKKSYVALHDN